MVVGSGKTKPNKPNMPAQAIPKACGFEAATQLFVTIRLFEKTKPICRWTN